MQGVATPTLEYPAVIADVGGVTICVDVAVTDCSRNEVMQALISQSQAMTVCCKVEADHQEPCQQQQQQQGQQPLKQDTLQPKSSNIALSMSPSVVSAALADAAIDTLQLAIEVDGPSHYAINQQDHMLAPTACRNWLLQQNGWTVVLVSSAIWDTLAIADQKRHYIVALLLASI